MTAAALALLTAVATTAITVLAFEERPRVAAAIPTYAEPAPSPASTSAERAGSVTLRADDATGATTAERLAEWEGRTDVLRWEEGDAIEWEADVMEAGSYELAFAYYPLEGNGQDIEYELYIDGQGVSADNEPFRMNRVWRDEIDESGEPKQSRGNDLRPRQIEQRVWLETKAALPGSRGGAYVASLAAGKHRIRIENVREAAAVEALTLSPAKSLASYEEYRRNISAGEAGEARGDGEAIEARAPDDAFVMVQGEHAYLKSSAGIFPTMDRSSPLTTPYHPVKLRLNTIGGSNWDTPGQWISWQLEVPETGWYKLGLRYRQHEVKGAFVTRTIYVDGEIPFAELERVRFPYRLPWAVKELGEETGEPYLFYLDRGKHEIKLEVTLGDMAEPLRQANGIVAELQGLYRQIVMITGVRPDPYRDYELEKAIPELLPSFEALKGRMEEEADRLVALADGGNPGTRALTLLTRQLEDFLDRPDTIPKRLDSYKTNMTGLADWMLSVSSQPLEIDYLYLAAADRKKPRGEANGLERGAHELRAFVGSFFENYNALGDEGAGNSIEVWTGLGRDQAYVAKRLIDETFTPETGIEVDFNLVENSLVVAVMAGEGPDVNLLTSRGDAMNLAIRGALVPLDEKEGFEALQEQYMPSAFVPYRYEGNTYAVPDEQEFFMMFTREDILSELGVDPPQTWEELLEIAPLLQIRNMQIGLPYENLDAFQLLARGIGSLNLFPSLLMQHGGGLYNESLSATRFDEPGAFKAFKLWTDFYMLFDYPLYKDDFNRFRTGEMPIVISSYKLYNRLAKAAPEIAGTWRMAPMPGVERPDGGIDRTAGATGTAGIILQKAADKPEAWTFLRWWNQPEIQSRFVKELENELGVLGRRSPANREAFESSNWSRAEQAALLEQWRQVEEIPELPGGYYTSRNIDNAFRDVVFSMEHPRESLFYWNKQINEEIERKRYEFGVGD